MYEADLLGLCLLRILSYVRVYLHGVLIIIVLRLQVKLVMSIMLVIEW